MGLGTVIKYYFQLAIDQNTFRRALKIAIFVGILNLINNSGIFQSWSLQNVNFVKVFLTFLVPFLVSTHSTILATNNKKAGSISKTRKML